MRLSLRMVSCSIATLIGVACSGTTVTQSDMRGFGSGGAAGAGGHKAPTSAAGYGGQAGSPSGGAANAGGQLTSATTTVAIGGSGAVAGASTVPETAMAGSPTAAGAAANGGNSATGGSRPEGGNATAGRSVAAGGNGALGGAGVGGGSVTLGGAGVGGGSIALGGAATSAGSPALGGSGATGGTTLPPTAAPSISSVSPPSGIVTTTLVVAGHDFGATQGTSIVTIGGNTVVPSYWSNTAIEVPVPRTAYPGTVSLSVSVNEKQSNSMTFDVILPRTIYINKADRSAAGNAVSAFSLTAFGTVQKLQNSPFPTGDSGSSGGLDMSSLAFNRATRRLFAVNEYSLTAFDIDPVTGQLTRTANSPVSTGAAGGAGVAVNSAGTLAFVSNQCALADGCRYSSASISIFKVSAAGTLTAVTGTPFAQGVSGGLLNPALIRNEQFLVSNTDFTKGPPFNALVVNSVNPTTGLLTPITGSPFGLGTQSFSGRADPTGTWYYLSDNVPQLTGYSFLSSGTPVLLSGMPIATKTTSIFANCITMSPNGAYLYMGLYDGNELSGFSVGAGGNAALLPGSPYGLYGLSAVTALGVSRNNLHLVVADAITKMLMAYPINGQGIPSGNGQGEPFDDVGGASGLVIAE